MAKRSLMPLILIASAATVHAETPQTVTLVPETNASFSAYLTVQDVTVGTCVGVRFGEVVANASGVQDGEWWEWDYANWKDGATISPCYPDNPPLPGEPPPPVYLPGSEIRVVDGLPPPLPPCLLVYVGPTFIETDAAWDGEPIYHWIWPPSIAVGGHTGDGCRG